MSQIDLPSRRGKRGAVKSYVNQRHRGEIVHASRSQRPTTYVRAKVVVALSNAFLEDSSNSRVQGLLTS